MDCLDAMNSQIRADKDHGEVLARNENWWRWHSDLKATQPIRLPDGKHGVYPQCTHEFRAFFKKASTGVKLARRE
jgi:hypothetical protein